MFSLQELDYCLMKRNREEDQCQSITCCSADYVDSLNKDIFQSNNVSYQNQGLEGIGSSS
jgi:hypothetical protein